MDTIHNYPHFGVHKIYLGAGSVHLVRKFLKSENPSHQNCQYESDSLDVIVGSSREMDRGVLLGINSDYCGC